LRRLTLEGQGHYESRERSAWRTIRDTAAR
jgi:hypothetical protein